MSQEFSLTDRLLSLWDHLGLRAAHIGAQLPDEVAGLASAHPERIAGLMISEAIGLDPAPFRSVASRLWLVAGDCGMSAKVADSVAPLLPGCRREVLEDYGAPMWADSVSDHTETIVSVLSQLSGEATTPGELSARGSHAGVDYEVQGAGPALVLFPMYLSAAQWSAALPELAARYTVILLSGRHLGGVALLEERALSPSYAGMVKTLFDTMAVRPDETLLEVGCGPGALARLAVRHFGGANPVTAVDVNGYLLKAARELARQDGLGAEIDFRRGDAERLPFADASFDHAYTVTVLEECDANLALRELRRVVKPGGRVGIIVRAIDEPHRWRLDLPAALREKIEAPSNLIGQRGVADASLYARMLAAGFETLTCFPMLASHNRWDGPFWAYQEGRVLGKLTAGEAASFRDALRSGREAGVLFMSAPHHCVVGRTPGG